MEKITLDSLRTFIKHVSSFEVMLKYDQGGWAISVKEIYEPLDIEEPEYQLILSRGEVRRFVTSDSAVGFIRRLGYYSVISVY